MLQSLGVCDDHFCVGNSATLLFIKKIVLLSVSRQNWHHQVDIPQPGRESAILRRPNVSGYENTLTT